MKSPSASSPRVALPALPSALLMPTAVAKETLLRPSGTELRLWQGMEVNLNFALKHGLYLSLDMLLFMIQDINENLVLIVFHLI